MCYDTWKEMVTDLSIMNKDMAARMSKLKTEYYDVKRENYDLRMRLVFAKNALRDDMKALPPTVVKAGCNDPDPQYYEPAEYTCGMCDINLMEEWTFCPSCGVWIDWDFPLYPDDDDSAYDAFRDAQLELALEAKKRGADAE